MPDDQFPYNPKSRSVATSIDWLKASPLAWDAPFPLWKKVSPVDLKRLQTEPRFARLYESLDAATKEKVQASIDGRTPDREPVAKAGSSASEKQNLLELLESVLMKADDAGDLTAELRAIELRGKLHALLTQKSSEEDRNITINIVTGIDRGSP